MKPILYLFILLLSVTTSFSQTNNLSESNILSQAEVDLLFTETVKKANAIDFPIFRVYRYSDKSGSYYVALTEKDDGMSKDSSRLHSKIKALNFKRTVTGLEKQWEVNDFTIKQTNVSDIETSIWFWTKYASFVDLDKDSLVDPILVYGTFGSNGYDDGRIKILCFYKGKKIAIRHQNGVLDFERNTQVDPAFYDLPISLQNKMKEIMQEMVDNNHAIFPYNWKEAMKRGKLKFDEKN